MPMLRTITAIASVAILLAHSAAAVHEPRSRARCHAKTVHCRDLTAQIQYAQT